MQNRLNQLCGPMSAGVVILLSVNAALAAKPDAATSAPKNTVSIASAPLGETLAASRRVDKLIAADYKKQGIRPNAICSDETFVRRVYLDIVGRIPTYDETIAFLDSDDAKKRSRLIDKLLDSEGYVSHQFNYFADLLRLQSRMRYVPAQPYLDFVKDSLRENKPYDQFVRELITAEGYTWDNGAAGYYLRDTGMPLDNMSNTAQVFLGTQLVCAQCHDHPFDDWTQKQYYQLAAFSYGVETRDRNTGKYLELRQMRRDESLDQEVYRAANRILQPLAYRVNETDRRLRLPDDYQYGDLEPRAFIDPAVIFGEDVELEPGDSRKEIYARWMTSPENPRFTVVIANRLWKRVMGVGLIEPVDDFKDGVNPSNPKLMAFLAERMAADNYDLKKYLRILYNTKTYQREVSSAEVADDETYYFPGPVLRRATAEQLWDSLLTIAVPDLDERQGYIRENYRYAHGEELVDMEMEKVLTMAEVEAKRRKAQVEYSQATSELQKDLRVASRTGDQEAMSEIRAEMAEIRSRVFGTVDDERRQRIQRQRREQQRETDPRWDGFSRDLVRASEVESPARPGHFLRQFGQSDRETIENADDDATVPQILTLLNGPMFNQLLSANSLLQQNLAKAANPRDKLEVIFVSILNRRPTEQEAAITLPEIESGGREGIGNVAWALLNTRQFLFVQ